MMAGTLRQLLVQRAARLKDRPAFTAPEWGTLSYAQFRNRVEGIALGLLARPRPPGSPVHLAGASPWAWAAEVAAACAGLRWEAGGEAVPGACLGGPLFNSEEGRGSYHDREEAVTPELGFHLGLAQGDVLRLLARWNLRLGWDHEAALTLPLAATPTPGGRAALWSALFAGAHVTLGEPGPAPKGWFSPRAAAPPAFDASRFEGFWEVPS